MKRAPLLLSAGTAAGFISVLGFHLRQAPPVVAGPRPSAASPSRSPRRLARPGRAPAPSGALWARTSSSATACSTSR